MGDLAASSNSCWRCFFKQLCNSKCNQKSLTFISYVNVLWFNIYACHMVMFFNYGGCIPFVPLRVSCNVIINCHDRIHSMAISSFESWSSTTSKLNSACWPCKPNMSAMLFGEQEQGHHLGSLTKWAMLHTYLMGKQPPTFATTSLVVTPAHWIKDQRVMESMILPETKRKVELNQHRWNAKKFLEDTRWRIILRVILDGFLEIVYSHILYKNCIHRVFIVKWDLTSISLKMWEENDIR